MDLKRVVVTGLGALTPLGKTVADTGKGYPMELMAVILLSNLTPLNLKRGLPARLKILIPPNT